MLKNVNFLLFPKETNHHLGGEHLSCKKKYFCHWKCLHLLLLWDNIPFYQKTLIFWSLSPGFGIVINKIVVELSDVANTLKIIKSFSTFKKVISTMSSGRVYIKIIIVILQLWMGTLTISEKTFKNDHHFFSVCCFFSLNKSNVTLSNFTPSQFTKFLTVLTLTH